MKQVKKRNINGRSVPASNKSYKTGLSWWIVLCLFFAIIAYLPVFRAGFVDWDDGDYASGSSALRIFSDFWALLKKPVQGNYHPLTMLSLSFNFHVFGKSPFSFHVLNLLIHLVNIFLVYWFFKKLLNGKELPGIIAALFFGIHPLHVESVAWISERKDVLYTAFFLLSMITYLRYLKSNKFKDFLFVFFFFILSILSKPAAMVFPLVLLAIDFYYSGLGRWRTWLEKIPFFLFSVLFGVLTLKAQGQEGAIPVAGTFPLISRFFFGNYGIMSYLWKTIYPVNLCAFYSFPAVNVRLPLEYFISPAVTLSLITLFFIFFKKNKIVSFSIAFYLINLLLVLQFFPVGSAVIADRYSYIPLLGPFFLIGYFTGKIVEKKKRYLNFFIFSIVAVITIYLTTLSYYQSSTWKDDKSLWDQAIKVSPSSLAYSNRGHLYKQDKQNDEAIEMFNAAIRLNKLQNDTIVARANIFFSRKQYIDAINDYGRCIANNPKLAIGYQNRGVANAEFGKLNLALDDFNKCIELDPNSDMIYMYRGQLFLKMNKDNEAIKDFQTYLSKTMDKTGDIWNSLGCCYQNLKDYKSSIESFSKAIQISQNGLFYYNRAISFYNLHKFDAACEDASMSISLGYNVSSAFFKAAHCK